jgi:hypothetical protein
MPKISGQVGPGAIKVHAIVRKLYKGMACKAMPQIVDPWAFAVAIEGYFCIHQYPAIPSRDIASSTGVPGQCNKERIVRIIYADNGTRIAML